VGKDIETLDAVKNRDQIVLEKILTHFEGQNKKLKVIELGSGRGGLSRFLTKELAQRGMLEHFTASNISRKENEYNEAAALREGITSEFHSVVTSNFDEMQVTPDSFDVVLSCDCFLHSADKAALMKKLGLMLKKGGLLYFSDILEKKDSDKQVLDTIY
jgi:2-polyprenyl-3-methyl-5-hydroxy-6-metoxy-1,4-benzoquinol methylase